MKYRVKIKKKVNRGLKKLPVNVQKLLFLLIEDLKADGPIQKSWNNFYPWEMTNITAI
jgi:mRNA-degrading endonuclease RelE of RelBE toxin-antitoxin system